VIEGSLRCFACGFVGLVPLLGVPFILLANRAYLRSGKDRSCAWNPARRYRRVGHGLTCVGAFLQVLAIGSLVLAVLGALELL